MTAFMDSVSYHTLLAGEADALNFTDCLRLRRLVSSMATVVLAMHSGQWSQNAPVLLDYAAKFAQLRINLDKIGYKNPQTSI
jgi:hypothetical protein